MPRRLTILASMCKHRKVVNMIKRNAMVDFLISVLRIAVLAYVGMALVLAGCQRHMMYYPMRVSESNALALAGTDGLEPWRDDDGNIIGWRPADSNPEADILLFFHGNAGFGAQRGYMVHGFSPRMTVYIMEYPGYGTRAGRPSEQAFYRAAAAAFSALREAHPDQQIFLGGESLGSGVACHLAGRFPDKVAGLFLSTPFNHLVDVARYHYPVFPVRWLMRDRYHSAKHLAAYDGPLALLLAGRDEVVPARFGHKLADAYAGPTRIWLQEDRSHNTLDYRPGSTWWQEALDFLGVRNDG